MTSPEILLLEQPFVLFLLNVAMIVLLAAGVSLGAAVLLRRRSAPMRHGVLLCGLAVALLAPLIALVADVSRMGCVEVFVEAKAKNRPESASPPKTRVTEEEYRGSSCRAELAMS